MLYMITAPSVRISTGNRATLLKDAKGQIASVTKSTLARASGGRLYSRDPPFGGVVPGRRSGIPHSVTMFPSRAYTALRVHSSEFTGVTSTDRARTESFTSHDAAPADERTRV